MKYLCKTLSIPLSTHHLILCKHSHVRLSCEPVNLFKQKTIEVQCNYFYVGILIVGCYTCMKSRMHKQC